MIPNEKANWTVVDVWIGLFFYFFIFEIIGLIFAENKGEYFWGLLTGCLTAAYLIWHMSVSLETAVQMEDASHYMKKKSMFRGLVMLGVAFLGMRLPCMNFTAAIMGMLGLKISALLQPYTNLYITKKIKKGK